MAGQGLNPLSLGGSENVGAETSQSSTTDALNNDTYVSTSDDLNSIISNAEADDTIHLLPGTHTVTKDAADALVLSVDNLTLKGEGAVKLEDSAGSHVGGADNEAVIAITGNGVTVRGIEIDGNKANQSTASGERVSGIRPAAGATDWTIEHVEIHDCTNGGIKTKGTDKPGAGGGIEWCEVYDVDKDGIFPNGKRLRGAHNYVHDCPNQDGIEPLDDYQVWEHNIVENCAGSGFDVFGPNGVTVENNIVLVGSNGPQNMVSFNNGAEAGISKGNVFVGSGVTGASGTSDRMIAAPDQRGCKSIGDTSYGAAVQMQLDDDIDFDLVDATVVDSGDSALQVRDGGTSEAGKFRVDGLTAVDCQRCVLLDAGTKDMTFDGCKSVRSTSRGFNVDGADHVFKNCVSIDDPGGFDGTIDGTRFINCEVRNAGNAGGFNFDDPTDLDIIDCSTTDCSGRSIELDAASSDTFSRITIRGHRSDGDSWGIDIDESTGTFDKVVIEDTRVRSPANFDYDLTVSGVLFRNGTHLISGADASASDYDSDDAGRRIIKSDATKKEWVVEGDGSINQIV